MKLEIDTIIMSIFFAIVAIAMTYLFTIRHIQTKIFLECMKLQRYTPETELEYTKCMEDHGLDPEDWS